MLLSVFHDEVWLPSCANLRECTMVGYESAWRCHIADAFGGMLIVAFHAIWLNTDWNAAKEWETSTLFTLPAGLEAAFEVHCAAVSRAWGFMASLCRPLATPSTFVRPRR